MGEFRASLGNRSRSWLRDTINYAAIRTGGMTRLASADPAIHTMVEDQTARWRTALFDRTGLGAGLEALSHEQRQVFVFDIREGVVTVRSKTPVMPSADPYYVSQTRDFFVRAGRYRTLLGFVLSVFNLKLTTTLAIDVNDYPVFDTALPVFAFQNTARSKALLLPDIDFVTWNWYRRLTDRTPYDQKAVRAVFAGSSSGKMIDVNDVVPPATPRLAAAAYFVGHPHVDFRISRAVQCTSAARPLLERQPYFRPALTWPQQWQSRFLISLDGNGATCSRVALSLKSRSALIKFASPFTLFYFGQLRQDRDFIAVERPADIEEILETELGRPGYYRDIAEAGQAFYRRFLDCRPIMVYTALLLQAYAETVAR